MKVGADGKFADSGVPDCIMKTVQREGVLGLWVGLPVYLARVSPHAMIVINFIYNILDTSCIRWTPFLK